MGKAGKIEKAKQLSQDNKNTSNNSKGPIQGNKQQSGGEQKIVTPFDILKADIDAIGKQFVSLPQICEANLGSKLSLRKLNNRYHAKLSRERQKKSMEDLKKTCIVLTEQNEELQKRYDETQSSLRQVVLEHRAMYSVSTEEQLEFCRKIIGNMMQSQESIQFQSIFQFNQQQTNIQTVTPNAAELLNQNTGVTKTGGSPISQFDKSINFNHVPCLMPQSSQGQLQTQNIQNQISLTFQPEQSAPAQQTKQQQSSPFLVNKLLINSAPLELVQGLVLPVPTTQSQQPGPYPSRNQEYAAQVYNGDQKLQFQCLNNSQDNQLLHNLRHQPQQPSLNHPWAGVNAVPNSRESERLKEGQISVERNDLQLRDGLNVRTGCNVTNSLEQQQTLAQKNLHEYQWFQQPQLANSSDGLTNQQIQSSAQQTLTLNIALSLLNIQDIKQIVQSAPMQQDQTRGTFGYRYQCNHQQFDGHN